MPSNPCIRVLVNPKNGKRIICSDENSYKLMSAEERAMIDNFNSGDYVFLTQKNSIGLIDGIVQAGDLIASLETQEKQMI